ncbi:hypothetical protein [Sphingomonas sp. LY160]|uniref:hypothetical protein n=1 Tax=Sphingomonas sp. LY160 TaxID=3095342 RepID=UPI002ADEE9FE|nr:hypothetical protein [Sphingomonas sp. LY160]MEA1072492.1 hypothetical protein [Sphingomonas sp. LY160]
MEFRQSYPTFSERMVSHWERGVRIATRFAIGFGLSTLAGIGIGFAVTDDVLAQIFVTVLSAFALWIPIVVILARVERWRLGRQKGAVTAAPSHAPSVNADFERDWRRLTSLAPREGMRLSAIKSSIDRSRLALGKSELDPDAKDLCVLIDRRLPELLHHALDDLPPDDTGRRRQVGELIDLVEQFARHCGKRRDTVAGGDAREAAILRRRFEARLADYRDGL